MEKQDETAIELRDVTKIYFVHHEKPTFAERILHGNYEKFCAVNKLSLTIKKGERVGLIGPNGSGKTTLLKLITGISTPTSGTISTSGKIVSLIDLEAGFHPDMTGIQNIFLSGMLIGMSRNDIEKNLQKIIKFAGIGRFIDTSVFTYSSGMKLRLGFAIAAYSNPTIIAIDENVSVGDYKFRKKIWRWIDSFIKKGHTLILASHEMSIINSLCTRIVKLDKGMIIGSKKKALF